MLIAPIFAPATSFEPPATSPYVISLQNSSLAELMHNPAAWAIVLKHIPSLQQMVAAPRIKPHLGDFTVQSVQSFVKAATAEALAAIDVELARLPPIEAPLA